MIDRKTPRKRTGSEDGDAAGSVGGGVGRGRSGVGSAENLIASASAAARAIVSSDPPRVADNGRGGASGRRGSSGVDSSDALDAAPLSPRAVNSTLTSPTLRRTAGAHAAIAGGGALSSPSLVGSSRPSPSTRKLVGGGGADNLSSLLLPSSTHGHGHGHGALGSSSSTALGGLVHRIHRLRTFANAQYLYITRKRLPFVGRQIDKFQELPAHARAMAFLLFMAWKFFMTFFVMTVILKKSHSILGFGGGGGAAAEVMVRSLGAEESMPISPPLRVLYVLTALSAPPPYLTIDENSRIRRAWFQEEFSEILTEDGLLFDDGDDLDVDFYVISPSSPKRPGKELDFDLPTEIAGILPPGVGLEVWEDALPPRLVPSSEKRKAVDGRGDTTAQKAPQKKQNKQKNKQRKGQTKNQKKKGKEAKAAAGRRRRLQADYSASGARYSTPSLPRLTPSDRVLLARRHRHVVRDKLGEYDVFVCFSDDGGGRVSGEHVRRFWSLSERLDRGGTDGEEETIVVPGLFPVEGHPSADVAGGVLRGDNGGSAGSDAKRMGTGNPSVNLDACCRGADFLSSSEDLVVPGGTALFSGEGHMRRMPSLPSEAEAEASFPEMVWMVPSPSARAANGTAAVWLGGWTTTRSQLLRALSPLPNGDQRCDRPFLPPFDSDDGGSNGSSDAEEEGEEEERRWINGEGLFLPPSSGGCGAQRVAGTDPLTFSGQLVPLRQVSAGRRLSPTAAARARAATSMDANDVLARLAAEWVVAEKASAEDGGAR